MMRDLNSSGALPALELTMRYAGERQRLIAHNIANIDTPNFVARDVDPRAFQAVLADAVDRRQDRNGGSSGGLDWEEDGGLARGRHPDSIELRPGQAHGGVLRHDRNATDLERLMQDMVENASMFRVAADLIRRQKSTLLTAIAQRVG